MAYRTVWLGAEFRRGEGDRGLGEGHGSQGSVVLSPRTHKRQFVYLLCRHRRLFQVLCVHDF